MKTAIILLAIAIPWAVAFPNLLEGIFDDIFGGGNKNHDDDCHHNTDKHGAVRSNIFF